MVEIKVPVISTEGKVGYVVRWYKNDGDEVKEGEEIAEVMIEKTTLHIQAPLSGKLKNTLRIQTRKSAKEKSSDT